MKYTTEHIKTRLASLLETRKAPVALWHDPHGTYAADAERIMLPAGASLVVEDQATTMELLRGAVSATVEAPLIIYRKRFHQVAEGDILADLEACAPRISFEAGTAEHNHGKSLSTLTEDWYTPEDFASIVQAHAANGFSTVPEMLAPQFGFSLCDGCVLRNTWPNPQAYYRTLLNEPLVPHSNIVPKILESAGFNAYVDLLHERMELFEYDKDTWITPSGFTELGIAQEDLVQFGRDVTRRCDEERTLYGTMPWLHRAGDDIKLLRYELSDEFYQSVLRLKRLRFGNSAICGVPFFSVHNAQPSGRAFIEDVVRREESIALEGLLELMQEDFGIPLTRNRLITLVRQTKLFFSPEADRVYIDHDQFIREME